jgi:hypothetical protein
VIWHGWDEFVEHAALPEQRMRANLRRVGLEQSIHAEAFAPAAPSIVSSTIANALMRRSRSRRFGSLMLGTKSHAVSRKFGSIVQRLA